MYSFLCSKSGCGKYYQCNTESLVDANRWFCDDCTILENKMTKKKDISDYETHIQKTFNGNTDIVDDRANKWSKDPIPLGNGGGPFYSDKAVDPKQACAAKKMTFDAIPITLKLLASEGAASGAEKYGVYNWLSLPDNTMSLMTYINAVERHLTLFKAGQDRTSDTDIHNLDSIIVGLAVVRDAMLFNKVRDDRVKLSEENLVILEKIINKETKL